VPRTGHIRGWATSTRDDVELGLGLAPAAAAAAFATLWRRACGRERETLRVLRDLARATSTKADARAEVSAAAVKLLRGDGDMLFVPDDGALVSDIIVCMPLPHLRVELDDPNSVAARAFRDQELVFARGDGTTELEALRDHGARGVLAGPMTRLGVRLGVCMTVWRSPPRRLSHRDRQLAEMLSDEKGMAIQHSEQFAQALDLARAHMQVRLARDLHDSVAQDLAVLRMHAHTVAGALEQHPEAVAEIIPHLELHAAKAQDEMRALLDALRAGRPVSDGGVPDVVDALVTDFRQRCSDVDVSVEFPGGDDVAVRPEVRETVYYVLRESLHNAAKHARANRVRVRADCDPQAVTLTVEDDGRGFDLGAPTAGRHGLVGMRERAELAGGQLDVRSERGSGTTVRLRIENP
jgi:signal transduction histidine kinase